MSDQTESVLSGEPGDAPRVATVREAERATAEQPAPQMALAFDPAGGVAVVTEPADAHRRPRRDGIRGDARRTTEYIATRGTTPIEALHNVCRMKLPDAIDYLAKHMGCTKYQAGQFWQRCCELMLPYTAARLDTLPLADAAAATGGLAMAHFLAATAMGRELSASRSADGQSVDSHVTAEIGSQSEGGHVNDHVAALPPRGAD